jgi:glycosyltransferase involved in cell wall biosynthesis
MKILQLHNQYFSGLGGEDTVMRLEKEMLCEHGHEVRQLIVSTAELKGASRLRLLQASASSVWSTDSNESVANEMKAFQPDVVHVHNTFPLLSPSVYYAIHRSGSCVVQTLHNYRIACANGLLLRDGVPCQDCVGHTKWRGLLHRCYHGSFAISGSVVAMQTVHQIAGTYSREVDAYIALTSFQRDIMVREGLPAERIHLKSNFLPAANSAHVPGERKKQIVYIGYIRRWKGTDLLLQAWTRLRPDGYRLVLIGDGPDREEFQRTFGNDNSIDWMGNRTNSEVVRVLAESKYLVLCARWYEGFPMALLEALSAGTPAIAPNHAAFPEMLERGKCGFLFEPSNAESLAQALRLAGSTPDNEWREQSAAAFEKAAEFTSGSNYGRLMEIYEAARHHSSRSVSKPMVSPLPSGSVAVASQKVSE